MTLEKIYLCGAISHQTLGQSQDWREQVASQLDGIHEMPNGGSIQLQTYSPLRGETFFRDIKPDEKFSPTLTDNASLISTPNGVLGRDLNDCRNASLIFVNFLPSPSKVSIGSVYEVGFSKAHGIPIVMVMQDDNIHRHVFLTNSATYLVKTLEEGIAVSKFLLLPQLPKPQTIEVFMGLDAPGGDIQTVPIRRSF